MTHSGLPGSVSSATDSTGIELRDSPPPSSTSDGGGRNGTGTRPKWDLVGALRSWLGSTLVIVAMVIVFWILQPRFMTLLNWQNIAIQMSVLLVISIAGTFPIIIGSIDLSVGSVATLTGIVTAMMLSDGGTNWVLALITALLVGLACGLVNGTLLAVVRVPSFLVTLGTYFALDGLASFIITGTPIPIYASGPGEIFDARWGQLPSIFAWSLVVLLVTYVISRYTRFGRHFYAVGGSEPAALIAGIPVRWVKIAAFAISGLLAAFAGFLLSVHTLSGSPQMGASLLLPSIGAIVMGGTALSGGGGGPHRTFIGVLLLTILINGMQLLSVDPYLQLVILGGVVILAVVTSREKLSVFSAIK